MTPTPDRPAVAGGQPCRDRFLVFGSPAIEEAEIAEVVATLRSGWLGTGPKVKRFQADFQRYTGAPHALALNSCTAALHLALLAAGIEAGDEVILPALTFAATANAVIHAGGTPVFVDVDPRSQNIDPPLIEAAITPKTRVLLPVHFAGRPCDLDAIQAIARRHGLLVIEDAAHATEAWFHGRKIGSIGDATCFSFYATKNLVTGEGGMLTTPHADWAARVQTLGLHGLSSDAWMRYGDAGYRHYTVECAGYKYNMMDIQASLGLHQLARISSNLLRREAIWARYDEAFRDLPVALPPAAETDTVHARHLYTLHLDLERIAATRDEVMGALIQENIGTGVHFVALHLHPFYRRRLGLGPAALPHSSWISQRTLSLPLSAKLSDQDVQDVITALRRVLAHYRR